MHVSRHDRSRHPLPPRAGRAPTATARIAILVAVLTAALLPLPHQPTAGAVEAPVDAPVTGNATWYDALGVPYGGCGLPENALDSEHFIALNVYDTPRDYVFYPRPMPDGDPKIGMWDNGHNCGRWVQVTIGDYCTGVNDGVAGQDFCRLGGEWVADRYNGATLNMIVADSCGDANAWCRDDPYHIDLAHHSLNRFVKDGVEVGDMDPDHWNNRHVSWKFIPAPDYSGDIRIGFLQGSKPGWTAVAVSHLANGIHGMDFWSEGAWHDAGMDGDMGQAFIISPTETGGTEYAIRVSDVTDEYVNAGRVYSFALPSGCDPECSQAYQQVSYTTGTEPPGADGPPPTCSAAAQTVKSWPDGYQVEVTVTAGESRIRGWRVDMVFSGAQTVGDVWNGVRSVDGSAVTVTNASWNGILTAGASTTFGFLVSGAGELPTMTCTAS